MPRYIDADKLAEHKFSYVTYDRYSSDGRRKSEEEIYAYKVGYNEAIATIAQFAPTIDAVEIVRCRECKWWKSNFTWNGKEVKVCVKEPYEPVRKENYFCADGERRCDD